MPIVSSKRPSLAALQTLSDVQALKPEWLRIPAASRVSGLSRQQIFCWHCERNDSLKTLEAAGSDEGYSLDPLRFVDGIYRKPGGMNTWTAISLLSKTAKAAKCFTGTVAASETGKTRRNTTPISPINR
jgi:hypothetical protein